jgi:GxxExxY protein
MYRHASGHEALTERIIAAAMEVQSVLGAGLMESVYERCFASELRLRGIAFEIHRPVPVIYKGRSLGRPLIVDFVVEDVVLVEIKAVAVTADVHVAQVITYLKLTGCPVGLLINFNVPHLRNGIRRLYKRAEDGKGRTRDQQEDGRKGGTS